MPATKSPDEQKVRHGARAVIVDDEGKFAILEVNGGEYFKIPGGGIEEGESEEEALRREVREETGLEIKILKKIDERQFQGHFEGNYYINHSVCYLAKKKGAGGTPKLMPDEKKAHFRMFWVTLEDAISLFNGAKPQTAFHSKMNERDKGFLMNAQKLVQEL